MIELLIRMLVALCICAPAVARAEVLVAAASDLVYCMQELNAEFRKARSDIDVVVSVGSSGTFFAQIRNGAPFDLFLSADMEFPRRLIEEGVADRSSLAPYAIGRIVLWSTRADLDLRRGIDVLTDKTISRIAIANPEHAPYGRAAKAAMEKAGIWNTVQPKVVFGGNISQARQFVQSGNADVGIIALSLVMAPVVQGIGQYALIPEDAHPRLEQGAVLTVRGAKNPGAQAYMEFLRSPQARSIFEKYGFVLPK
ncbi:MAG: molybdate ABC transporter substrate-binding protein [Pseudomonadota bacterium]